MSILYTHTELNIANERKKKKKWKSIFPNFCLYRFLHLFSFNMTVIIISSYPSICSFLSITCISWNLDEPCKFLCVSNGFIFMYVLTCETKNHHSHNRFSQVKIIWCGKQNNTQNEKKIVSCRGKLEIGV